MFKVNLLRKIGQTFVVATPEDIATPSYDPRYVLLTEDRIIHGMFHEETHWIIDNKAKRVQYAKKFGATAVVSFEAPRQPYYIDHTKKIKRKIKNNLRMAMRKALAEL